MMYHRNGNEAADSPSITIRLTRPTDMDELRRVAARDSRDVPDGELLVGIAEGEIRAAISLSSGEVTADPFHHTEELVRMLALQRTQMQRGIPRRRRGLGRLSLASG
jgi:hypothetical protein